MDWITIVLALVFGGIIIAVLIFAIVAKKERVSPLPTHPVPPTPPTSIKEMSRVELMVLRDDPRQNSKRRFAAADELRSRTLEDLAIEETIGWEAREADAVERIRSQRTQQRINRLGQMGAAPATPVAPIGTPPSGATPSRGVPSGGAGTPARTLLIAPVLTTPAGPPVAASLSRHQRRMQDPRHKGKTPEQVALYAAWGDVNLSRGPQDTDYASGEPGVQAIYDAEYLRLKGLPGSSASASTTTGSPGTPPVGGGPGAAAAKAATII